jgi:hypothetical protein
MRVATGRRNRSRAGVHTASAAAPAPSKQLSQLNGGSAVIPIAAVCWASAATGVFLGLQCGWQTAIESAQVLAGVVSYPVGNPFYVYHVKTWTLLHQLPALGLACGMRESVLSVLLGGMAGGLTFLAVSLTVLALTRSRLLAVLAPLLMFAASTYLETRGIYPLRMLSQRTWAIYGVVGSGWTMLAWALLALRRSRLAGLMMGLAPAVHPLLGAWCLAFGAVGAVVAGNRQRFKRWATWLAMGAACSVISFLVQWTWTNGLPDIASDEAAAYVNAYAAHWDTHRQPYPLGDASVPIAAVAVALLAAIWWKDPRRSTAATMAAILGLSTAAALVLCVATHFGEYLPAIVQASMPGRFINLTVLLFPVVVWAAAKQFCPGLAGLTMQAALCLACLAKLVPSGKEKLLSQTWPLFVAAGLGCLIWMVARPRWNRPAAPLEDVATSRRLWTTVGAESVLALLLIGLAFTLLGPLAALPMLVGFAVLAMRERRGQIAWHNRFPQPTIALARLAQPMRFKALPATVLTLAAAVWCAAAGRQAKASVRSLTDWRNDRFFAAMQQGEGMVAIVAGVSSTQLRSRRPVLLEVSSLNQLPYVPESGPEMNRILRGVYGEDLFAGPQGGQRRPGLAPEAARPLWESRDVAAWQRLGREFGIGQVMAYRDWQLQLPVVAKNRQFTLYRIPDPSGPIHD